MSTTLLPCPFCGCTDVSNKDDGDFEWFECGWCGATSGYDPAPEFEGKAASWHWNRRDPPALPDQPEREALVEKYAALFWSLDVAAIPKDVIQEQFREFADELLSLRPASPAGEVRDDDDDAWEDLVEGDRVVCIDYGTIHSIDDDGNVEVLWDFSGCLGDIDLDRLRPASARLSALTPSTALSAVRDEVLEEAAKRGDAWDSPSALRLAAGEMTAQELRTARAVARGIAAAIRSMKGGGDAT